MNNYRKTLAVLFAALLGGESLAQEGHPLTGSWSGNRMVDGKASRILLVMDLQRDQTITGYVLENGKRSALQNVELDASDWSVSFTLDGGYGVEGSIAELGSQTLRSINGTWTNGTGSGEFSVDIN
ncbi:MAG: hypothetical protein RLZZ227_2157 [Pseudomonadota bacterium]|jgi:hypothetical protein